MDFMNNISPEELLRKKEIDGGFEYDLPEDQILATRPPVESEIPVNDVKKPTDDIPVSNPVVSQPEPLVRETPKEPITSFGKSQKMTAESSPSNLGWKNIPVSLLPSGGIFYPDGTKIAIRAAEVKEIRHYSTIDEEDQLDIEEKLSYIIERCSSMEFPGEGVVSYKDLKQEDRFFIVMAIRDLTFTKGENMIILKPYKKCQNLPDCPFSGGIELRTGVLSSYEIDPEIMKYYDPASRCFVFNPKKIAKRIEVSIPSIGVTQEITNFIKEAAKRKVEVDNGFVSIAPFLFSDWRGLNFDRILIKMREIDNFWTKEEFSLYFELSERIKVGTKLEVKLECPKCGEKEVTANITFPRGLRSIFVISDIFRELF